MQTDTVIFYDGKCGLCSRSVRFIMKRDKKLLFKFSAFNSEFSKSKIGNNQTEDYLILFKNGKIYHRSTAVLKIASKLSGLWPLFYFFIMVPPFIRDAAYNYIAKKRYKWFGTSDNCKLTAADSQKDYFLL